MLRLLRNHPTACVLLLAVHWAPQSQAIELLTIHELVSHCVHLEKDPEGVDGQYCIRYIQGFIDGAVETDDRILQDMELGEGNLDALTERALRTRMLGWGNDYQPGSLAGFCLDDPVPLREVVDTVVADLITRDIGDLSGSPARVTVEDSLRDHYPCDE
ncbi:hypothetical protein E2F43_14720 [Seongchinamella unica]|uniref:Rap1a immunity protein domain-containing protein n=1 Tax=Seongchinamella unica TaxID=2547392 RepID=A0A4V2ZX30_9GAMM|nr:Rap1a/Tai family immunity protein [Seongchinamella unica]TDG12813.1 hypothetical protein E2F43_14720 [Seongchinamella unica]